MIIEDFLTYLRYELNLSAYTVLCYKTDLGQMVEFLCGGDAAAFDAGTVTAAMCVLGWRGLPSAEWGSAVYGGRCRQ